MNNINSPKRPLKNSNNNYILNNMKASEKMKNEILKACKKEKRTTNFLFRYSKQIAAAFAILILGASGVTAYAGITYIQRLSSMPEQEKQEYIEITDTFKDGSLYARSLSQDENNRMLALLDEYRNGRFPENTITVVKTSEELIPDTLCYVEEDGILYLPENELTDEQLLEYIDYKEKFNYVAHEQFDDNADEYYEELVEESKSVETINDMSADECDRIIKEFVKNYLGETIDDSFDSIITPCNDFTDITYLQKNGDHFYQFMVNGNNIQHLPSGQSKVTLENIKDLAAAHLKNYFDVTLTSTAEWTLAYTYGYDGDHTTGSYWCQIFSDDIATFVYQVNLNCETSDVNLISIGGSGLYYEDYPVEELAENTDQTLMIADAFIDKYAKGHGDLVSAYYRPICNKYDSTAEEVSFMLEYTNGYYFVSVNPATNEATGFTPYKSKESFENSLIIKPNPRDDEREFIKIK